MAEIGTDISKAKDLLNQGEVISIPTETVYGLAANALDENAVAKIFEIKERPTFDPLIVHFKDIDSIKSYVKEIPNELLEFMQIMGPSPVTYLLKKDEKIPPLVTSGLDSVAVRIPNHELTLRLLNSIEYPLAAPSANPFGYISPTTAQHVNDQLGLKIKYILDGGPCEVGLESTIIGFENGQLTIYRKGGLSLEFLEERFKNINILDHSSSNPKAPGMLKSHYAPKTKLKIWKEGVKIGKNTAFIGFDKPNPLFENNYLLSEKGSLTEAAKNLFSLLREIDKKNYDLVYLNYVEEKGLGFAINDRIKRATA